MAIQRVRFTPTGTDRYGDPSDQTESFEEIPGPMGLASAYVFPRSSSDVDGPGRAGVTIGLTLHMQYGYDLRHDDEVDVNGVRFRVDGEPGHWQHPTTEWQPGAEVALVRAEG